MRPFHFAALASLALLAATVFLAACKSSSSGPRASKSTPGLVTTRSARGNAWERQLGPVPVSSASPGELFRSVNLKTSYISKGRYSRRRAKRMRPTYITIHSTQNYTGDAWAHAKALKKGALRGGSVGYLGWHFTVQEDVAVQHTPTNEQGHHAEYDGPGNWSSIGIEMAEHRGNDLARTIDRTARLTAHLMYTHKIPLNHVVPHYHWPRRGQSPAHKNCPHFLLDSKRPGTTWGWFLSRVDRHYQRLFADQNKKKA